MNLLKRYFYLATIVILILVSFSAGANYGNFANSVSSSADTLEGIVNIFITDDFENNSSKSNLQLVGDNGETYTLEKSAKTEFLQSGDRIRIIGADLKLTGLKSAVPKESKIELLARQDQLFEDNYGAHNYAVILFNFRNDRRRPFTKEAVEDMFFGPANSANSNINEMSRGKAWLTGDVFDNDGKWYTIDMDAPSRFEEVNELLMLAYARAEADEDINFQDYNSVVHILPNQSAFSWGGAGTTTPVFMKTDDGDLTKHYVAINGLLNEFIVTHEVMHNFGVSHDSKHYYPEGIYFGDPLGFDPYGNVFSYMGSGYGHISLAFSKYVWPNEFIITDIDKPGLYSINLAPVADTTAGRKENIQGVTIPVGPTTFWTIEYRDKIGMDAHNNWMNILGNGLAVYLQERDPNSDIQTFTPYQDDSLHPDILKENEEFTDPVIGLNVKAIGTTPGGLMNIQVKYQPGTKNIRVNKRDIEWPKTVTINHSRLINYTLQNNAYIDISDTFNVALFQKYESEEWETVEGQTRTISEFKGGDTISGIFTWIPQNTGTYFLRIIADESNQLQELTKFDNYAPKGESGREIEVTEECSDIQIVEHVSICGGDSYNSWSNSGQYQRTLLTSSGCDSTITTHLFVGNLLDVELFVGGDTLMSVNTFTTYQWYDENGVIDGATSNQHVIDKNGTYFLEVTDSSGCSAISNEIDLIKTGISEFATNQFKFSVVPNPSNGIFSIRIQNVKSGKYKLQLFDNNGQVQVTKEIHVNGFQFEKELYLSYLPKGNYFVNISNESDSFTQKIVLH